MRRVWIWYWGYKGNLLLKRTGMRSCARNWVTYNSFVTGNERVSTFNNCCIVIQRKIFFLILRRRPLFQPLASASPRFQLYVFDCSCSTSVNKSFLLFYQYPQFCTSTRFENNSTFILNVIIYIWLKNSIELIVGRSLSSACTYINRKVARVEFPKSSHKEAVA